jgi:4-hydroxythreonine-4-phosphate dehydrogenase
MGDPSGIGPEVALRACAHPRVRKALRPLLIGDDGALRDTARRLRLPVPFDGTSKVSALIEVSSLAAAERRLGSPCAAGAEAAYQSILQGVAAVQRGEASAIVTAPVSKHAIQSLGYDFPGHTEVIARLAGNADVRMMMAGSSLRVVLTTTHVSLGKVPSILSAELVSRTAEIARDALRRHFAVRRPRLALAGLNPHAGEKGAFGDEEERILEPAIEKARRKGVELSGPYPPDSVFFRARAGEFDAVIALYHDQGLIPFKLLHFVDGVNVTLGLPFPRTSPDHGTAYDIAGRGKADPSSMIAALLLAAKMSSGA